RMLGSPCDTEFSGPEPGLQIEVDLYPNPTYGDLTVRISGGLYGGTMDIYNALGQYLLQKRVIDGYNSIDLSYLPAGMYFYAVRDAGGRILKSGKIDRVP
ncbi:MAG: T9SS type A sorting domain-containing protein, partial [Saprospiraceae bacterium]|nr:T9SS type A sorting domain-containing protein [Saprospiraceae bacterium]